MKKLIKTDTELKQYLNVNTTFNMISLDPYQDSAIEKYLVDVMGEDLTDSLIDWYSASTPDPEETDLQLLLPFAQRVVAKFSFFEGAANFDLQLTGAGFVVTSNQQQAPASKDRVNRMINKLEQEGWDAIELLLRFLEANADDYPQWAESDAFTLQMRNFVNTADEFDKYVNIGKSRLKFRNMRNTIDNIEILRIEPIIGKPLAGSIKSQIQSGTLSDVNKTLLDLIARALCNLVAATEIDQKYTLLGEQFLSEIQNKLDEDPDSYPLYKDSIYVADRIRDRFENSEDYAFFVGQ